MEGRRGESTAEGVLSSVGGAQRGGTREGATAMGGHGASGFTGATVKKEGGGADRGPHL